MKMHNFLSLLQLGYRCALKETKYNTTVIADLC